MEKYEIVIQGDQAAYMRTCDIITLTGMAGDCAPFVTKCTTGKLGSNP